MRIEALRGFLIGGIPRSLRSSLRRCRSLMERVMAYAADARWDAFWHKPPGTTLSRFPQTAVIHAQGSAATYQRVYHYHVRKTAGTSLNSAFWALAGLSLRDLGTRSRVRRNGLVFVRHDRRLIEQGDYFFANSHIPAYSLRLPLGTFTITILRDPLDRLFSYYRYLLWAQEHPTDLHSEPFMRSLRNEIPLLGGSFGDFLDRIPPKRQLSQLYMFSERGDVDEAAERVLACSAICFCETFRQDLERLGEMLGLPLQERHERQFRMPFGVSEHERTKARELLEPEFALVERVKRAKCVRVI